MPMLATLGMILLICWLFGMACGLTFSGWIHMLLAAAVTLLVYHLILESKK